MGGKWPVLLGLVGALFFVPSDAKANDKEQARTGKDPFKDKATHMFLAVGGIDTVVGAPDGWVAPIGVAQGYWEFDNSPWDILVRATSVGAFAQVDRRAVPGSLGVGARAVADLVAHGDYRHFGKSGKRDRTQELTASRYGGDVFAHLTLPDSVTLELFYLFRWKMYGGQDDTTIPLPDSHAVHVVGGTVSYSDLERTNLFIVDGLDFRLTAEGERRPGFDNNAPPAGDSQSSLRVHGFLGGYLQMGNSWNVQFEVEGGATDGDDEQSAPYLGGMVKSSAARIPGLSYMEVRGLAPYARGSMVLGVPIARPWHLRGELGVHAFGMARGEGPDRHDNMVTSFSAALTGFAGGVVPFRLQGAHAAIDGSYDPGFGVMAYVILGAGKIEK